MYDRNVAVTGCTIEKTSRYDRFREKIHLSAVITGTRYPADTDKVYCALYDDLIKKADSKETLSEKDSLTGALAAGHIICYYEDFSLEMQRIRMSATPCTNIRKMI